MLPLVLAILVGLFLLLLVGRAAAARRKLLAERWPALLFAGAAILALWRGAVWPAFGFAGAAAIAWVMLPIMRARRSAPHSQDDAKDADARAILGVGANATADEIRAAYRAKMARAHPDRGGAHNEAARLTGARDRLLKGR